MENQTNEKQHNSILLSNNAITYINEMAGWTKFISIVGFIFLVFYTVIAIFTNYMILVEDTKQTLPLSPLTYFIATIVLTLILFFPLYFLIGFSNKINRGIKKHTGQDIDMAFKNLRAYYRFTGILTIIFIVGYISSIIVFYHMLSTLFSGILQNYPVVA